jgi:hypothetical protein
MMLICLTSQRCITAAQSPEAALCKYHTTEPFPATPYGLRNTLL